MKRLLFALALCAALGACVPAPPSPADPVATACAQLALVRTSPDGNKLDALDPHSATGILWADAKAACAAPAKANSAWLLGVLQLLAQAAPTLAPVILGAL